MGVPIHKQTLAEYLEWESRQVERHEFYRGETYLMVGGQRSHFRVIVKLSRYLDAHLDDSPCEVFSDGMKVQISDDTVLYPDVFVTCGKHSRPDDQAVTDPILVVEVVSPSTQAYDRSQKFAFYRRLPSLREYALVDPDTRRVEVMSLGDDGLWNFIDLSDQSELELTSVDFKLALTDLFKGMESAEPQAGVP